MIYKAFLFKEIKKKVLCENLVKEQGKTKRTYSKLLRPHHLKSASSLNLYSTPCEVSIRPIEAFIKPLN